MVTDEGGELTPEVVQEYKEELEAEKKALEDWLDTPIDLTGYEPDQRPEAFGKHENERREKKERLEDIEDALNRIKNGSFGICLDCGEKIPRERLDDNYTYKRCCPCQANHFAERMKGNRNSNCRPRVSQKKQ